MVRSAGAADQLVETDNTSSARSPQRDMNSVWVPRSEQIASPRAALVGLLPLESIAAGPAFVGCRKRGAPVAPEWQCIGLATVAVELLARRAQECGLTEFTACSSP